MSKKRLAPGVKPKVKWKGIVRITGYPIMCKTFDRKTDAQRWAEATESDLRRGRHVDTTDMRRRTLGQLIERYVEAVLPRKPKSAKKQQSQLRWWSEHYGKYTLAQLKPQLLAEARDKLLSEVTYRGELRSPATVKRYLAVLSHAFSVAVREWGWLENNPMERVTKPSESKGRIRFLERHETSALLEACKASNSPHLYGVVLLAVSTGMRQGEILGLRWHEVDLERESILLTDTKNGERRAVPLVGQALEMMRSNSQVRRLDTDLVFPGRFRPGQQAKRASIRTAWDKVISELGIEDFRFHDLRHTAASHLVMNGATLAEVAEILGHKTLQMVKRYAHFNVDHTRSVLKSMNERFLGEV
ncbi:MAG: tyrosine-type recombinase/integrase [Myxococcota bacterium]